MHQQYSDASTQMPPPSKVDVLGPYRLIRRVAVGGMAEVYEAVRKGPHGFLKKVALKRILPHIAEDSGFVSMFIQEALVSAQLSHPNIVQVFDFGEANGELFLAMELVEGTTVGRLMRALAQSSEVVPLDITLHLVLSAAKGLAHAHGLQDSSGQPLHLVHRDVSPGNLLLSGDGFLKLTDFGIVHTDGAERHTLTDHLRGKVGYMSPEQVRGSELTDRSDVFTLSVVFAELLLGESLFSRGADLDVLLKIRDVDLSVLRGTKQRIPSDVRGILLSGLDSDPGQRPSALELCSLLQDVMVRRGVGDGALLAAQLLDRPGLFTAATELSRVPRAPSQSERGAHGARHATTPSRACARNVAFVGGGTVDLPEQVSYRLPSGHRVAFPELARLCSTGAVAGSTPVQRNRDELCEARALPELRRYFSTPALQWTEAEVANPRLKGELRSAMLLPVIHSLLVHRESGVLYLEGDERRKKVYFVDGRPDFVASTDRSELLGDYLVEHGHCDAADLDMALAVLPRFDGRLGDALLGLGVLRPVELYRAVTAQVRKRYLDAFRWRNGKWRYVRDARSCEETYPIEQDVHLLMRDSATQLDASELESALSPLWERVVLPSARPPTSLQSYQLPDSWRWVIEQAQGRGTVGSLFGRCTTQSRLEPEDTMRAIFLGISCQLLEAA